eukprot:TRINITY_DN29673_c0_g1_i1.p1 TRINITY_DN29673_c0_g1~~TRINITY_DN29673_c0_g1_i1.p1  ORF type:complete len:131 (-),score=45.46 TRINITY_DN29673_c0_g1_i1:325-693(-)
MGILSFSKAQAYFQEYVQFFLKVSLADVSFIDIIPSLLPHAIQPTDHHNAGPILSPHWPDQLEMLSGYVEEQLGHLTTLLLFHHRLSVSSADEGYCSFTSSPTSPHGGGGGRGLPHCLWAGT